MTYAELFAAIDQAQLSPEAAAKRLGVSNMSLRRWRERDPAAAVPAKYALAFAPALAELAVAEAAPDGPAARVAADQQREGFRDTLKRLGFPEDILSSGASDREAMVQGLSRVGADVAHREEVDHSKKRISTFARWGAEWKERIEAMQKVLGSKEITATDKLVAYGALFYLITPFDLIPDAIPVIGYLDDFVVLGFALWYYRKRFPRLFGAR